MNRELILMRHGKSDWSQGVSDFKRPVKTRGIREATRVGQWLKEGNLVPDHIISSPAQRARETVEAVCKAMDFPTEKIHWDESVYMADISELLDAIATAPDQCERLMVVGHNPGMEDLVFYLSEDVDIPDDGKVMPTATIALLSTELDWADLEHATCELKGIVRGRYL